MFTVVRIFQNDKYTIGKMYLGDDYICDVLEPPRNVKHPCIPTGTYRMCYQHSTKYGKDMPFLQDVSGRAGIMIHTGNLPHQTQGCLIVGRNLSVGSVTNSKVTFDALDKVIRGLISLTGGAKITIKYK